MEEAGSDADFLSLLQEIERADAPLDALGSSNPSDLFDAFLVGPENTDQTANTSVRHNSVADALTGLSASHVERCRSNRKRKKQELEELRSAAAALESTLVQLTHPPPRDSMPLPSSWRDASRHALVERGKAIAEHKKLREILTRQWTAAQHIRDAIQATPVEQLPGMLQPSGASGRSLKRHRDATSRPSSWGLYYELFQNIHSAYERNSNTEEELARLTVGVRKISMDMVSQSPGGSTDMSIRVMECQQLPLSFLYMSNATWKHLSTPCLSLGSPGSELSRRSALTGVGDDLFGECGAECNPPSASGSLTPGRLAIRRYIEPNRLTFVWECDGCYQCDGAKKPIGRVTERGWCTIEPSEDGTAASTIFRIQVQELSSSMALDLYRATIARTFGAVEREVFKDTKCHAQTQCR